MKTKCLFTLDGMQLMRQIGLAPHPDDFDVDERDNADIIAKAIVVLQMVWFAIQLITRIAEGLAITALEIHTVVHVVCAILIYVLWWNKPYAVGRSVVLTNGASVKIAALYLFVSVLHDRHEKSLLRHARAKIEYWERRAVELHTESFEPDPPPRKPQKPSIAQALEVYSTHTGLPVNSMDSSDDILYAIGRDASAGFERMLRRNPDAVAILDQSGWRGVRQTADNFVLRQIWGSWTLDVGHEMSLAKLTHFAFNLLYGAGHLAAWNSTVFPTNTERWIWRASAIHVAGLFIYGSIWILYWTAVRSRSRLLLPFRSGDANIVMGPFFCLMVLAYLFARCYFFVEALASLRSLPESAYEVVRWTNYLPHSS